MATYRIASYRSDRFVGIQLTQVYPSLVSSREDKPKRFNNSAEAILVYEAISMKRYGLIITSAMIFPHLHFRNSRVPEFFLMRFAGNSDGNRFSLGSWQPRLRAEMTPERQKEHF
jgi:hypothetical protein